MEQQPLFTSEGFPEYHEGMLIVKIRPSAVPEAARDAAWSEPERLAGYPGWSALSVFERAGMIKRVIPLSRQTDQERDMWASRGMLAPLAFGPEEPKAEDLNAGVSLIELERDSDVPDLRIALAKDPSVEFADRVPVRGMLEVGAGILATPPPASTMWNLRKIRWAEARALPGFKEATNIRVAVLDTGIEAHHPDLRGRVRSYVYEYRDLHRVSSQPDIVGHGTHVAGTVAARINNALGINGICECKLFIWKIFDDVPDYHRGRGEFVYFVNQVMYRRALADCLEQDVSVINLSIGGRGKPDHQELALFNKLLANGTTIVAAMGNERREGSPISYPAAIPGVIAVGATNLNDAVASFSNGGKHISLCAPGVGIWSTLPTYPGQTGFDAIKGLDGRPIPGTPKSRETHYHDWQGTSMASPHVAAAAALLLANKGNMNGAAVRQQLMKTADKVPGMNGEDWHRDYGAGRLNLLRLLSE